MTGKRMAGWVDEWMGGWVEAWMAARGKHCAPPTPAGAAIHRLILALPLPSIPTSILPLIALVVAFALASGSSARGAGRVRETLDLALEPPQARTNGPMLTQVQFTWTGRGLLEGKLEIELRAGQELLTTCVTPDLALTTGTVRFAMLLPSVGFQLYGSELDVIARFHTRRRTFRFPATTWRVPAASQRGCAVCVCLGRRGWSDVTSAAARSLHLERFRPKPAKGAQPRDGLATVNRHTLPDEMPAQAIAYCAFDIVLLMGSGLSELSGQQLEALATWVRGGGSLCVVPGGGLQARHAEFLNALAGRPAFRVGEAGRVEALAPDAEGIYLFRAGLGRLVVAPPPETAEDVETDAWRRAAAFLWKIRREQLASVLGPTRAWNPELQKFDAAVLEQMQAYGQIEGDSKPPFVLYPQATYGTGNLLEHLMPQRVRVLPFGVMVLILIVFTVCVGPLDYLVLGRLRLHKLTWVVFPLTAVAFTWFTVRLAEHYIGLESYRRAVVFVDLDERWEPIRHSRYELIFSAGRRDEAFEIRKALFYTMGRGEAVNQGRYYPGGYPGPQPRVQGEIEPIHYAGRLPGHYVVAQRIRRWTPYLNRTFSFEPPDHPLELDEEAQRLPVRSREDIEAIARRALRGAPRRRAAYILHGQTSHTVAGSSDFAMLTAPTYSYGVEAQSFLTTASARPQVGFFAVVSQVSPSGAPDFEGLTILDPTDDSQWLLVIVEQHGDDIYVYRRLFIITPTETAGAPRDGIREKR